ncbi:MAG: SPOR domain-containing protein [Burkholderiaceae bacterium]
MKKSRQYGGTFLGLILGAVVGLAVALGVAIYVAKVPVPFANKGAARTSSQDAAEASKNRDWDPNAALRNRDDSAPAAPAAGATTGGAVAPAPSAMPIPAPAVVGGPVARTAPPEARASAAERTPPKPGTATRLPPSADPLGDLAAARSGTGTGASADPFTYFVQAGAFRAQGDAEAQRARLSLMGVEARVSEREQAGRTVYRVRVGPFQNRDAADRVKARLDDNGLEAALVRVQR